MKKLVYIIMRLNITTLEQDRFELIVEVFHKQNDIEDFIRDYEKINRLIHDYIRWGHASARWTYGRYIRRF